MGEGALSLLKPQEGYLAKSPLLAEAPAVECHQVGSGFKIEKQNGLHIILYSETEMVLICSYFLQVHSFTV